MHFWIDKRSQTCGFSGRHRVPSSLSAGSSRSFSRSHPRRSSGVWGGGSGSGLARPNSGGGVGPAKSMVTPVHRFQSIDSIVPTTNSGSSRSARNYHSHRSHHPSSNYRHQSLSHSGALASSNQNHREAHYAIHRTPTSPVNNSISNHIVEIDNGVLVEAPVVSVPQAAHQNAHLSSEPRIKCSSLWISITLLTFFIGSAKFYFSNQVLVLLIVLVIALVGSYYISKCRSESPWDMFETMVTAPQYQENVRNSGIVRSSVSSNSASNVQQNNNYANDNISEQIQSQEDLTSFGSALQRLEISIHSNNSAVNSVPPPPPYHIAILLPPQNNDEINQEDFTLNDESPPPSYEKIISKE